MQQLNFNMKETVCLNDTKSKCSTIHHCPSSNTIRVHPLIQSKQAGFGSKGT